MGFDRTDSVGGIRLPRVRAFLHDREGTTFSVDRIGQFFDLDPVDARAWIAEALELRFLEKTPRSGEFYHAGPAGLRLAASPLLPRIPREQGHQMVEELLQRARACASEAERWSYLVEFDVIALFGSVLGGRDPDIGDIDVLYKVQWLPEIRLTDTLSVNQLCLDLFEKDARSPRQILDFATWPATKLLRALRNRNGYISLHSWTQAQHFDGDVMVIYRWPHGRVPDPYTVPALEFVSRQRERDEARHPPPPPPPKRRPKKLSC